MASDWRRTSNILLAPAAIRRGLATLSHLLHGGRAHRMRVGRGRRAGCGSAAWARLEAQDGVAGRRRGFRRFRPQHLELVVFGSGRRPQNRAAVHRRAEWPLICDTGRQPLGRFNVTTAFAGNFQIKSRALFSEMRWIGMSYNRLLLCWYAQSNAVCSGYDKWIKACVLL